MSDFLDALRDPNVAFLRYSLVAGILASVSFGVVGTYVVARRISAIAGAIAHCVLGGIGAALWAQKVLGWRWCDPLWGAIASALLAAVLIGAASLMARQREDTIIGAMWAVGMAVGLLFLAKTPGYVDPMSYLFGNILLIGRGDLWLIAGLDILVAGIGALFYNKLLGLCFDEEFARLRNVRTTGLYMLLLCLTALTIVLLVRIVGIVMVIALLTLPAAIAGQFSRRLWQMMLWAAGLCMIFTSLGLGVSYSLNLPSGPVIIVIAAAAYLASAVAARLAFALRLAWRQSE
ncbi:MAG: Manganese transport system membrane protein MntB [candidate division BRC1 bacterium ADurb.BinA364]|nr:MAG: Manganese transport system membrane protein MntB [candidate division BRC1 bacterium ADurb.BinA364]